MTTVFVKEKVQDMWTCINDYIPRRNSTRKIYEPLGHECPIMEGAWCARDVLKADEFLKAIRNAFKKSDRGVKYNDLYHTISVDRGEQVNCYNEYIRAIFGKIQFNDCDSIYSKLLDIAIKYVCADPHMTSRTELRESLDGELHEANIISYIYSETKFDEVLNNPTTLDNINSEIVEWLKVSKIEYADTLKTSIDPYILYEDLYNHLENSNDVILRRDNRITLKPWNVDRLLTKRLQELVFDDSQPCHRLSSNFEAANHLSKVLVKKLIGMHIIHAPTTQELTFSKFDGLCPFDTLIDISELISDHIYAMRINSHRYAKSIAKNDIVDFSISKFLTNEM